MGTSPRFDAGRQARERVLELVGERDVASVDEFSAARDEGEVFTAPRPGAHDHGGLGLAIAQRISRRIGIVYNGHTHAWSEIANGANGRH